MVRHAILARRLNSGVPACCPRQTMVWNNTVRSGQYGQAKQGVDGNDKPDYGVFIMLTLSRNRPARGTVCHRCQVIRLFVIGVLALAIFALVAGDRLHVLQAVTPMRAAIAIWVVGITGFIIKLIFWRIQRADTVAQTDAKTSDDPEQA